MSTETLQSVKDELHDIYKVLEAHGIHIDQVDYDHEGRELYRWFVGTPDCTHVEMAGVEYWHTKAQALDAALSWLLYRHLK